MTIKNITVFDFGEKLKNLMVIRGEKVMIDRDLAELYGVNTKVMNYLAALLRGSSLKKLKGVPLPQHFRI